MDKSTNAVSPLMAALSAHIARALDVALPEHVVERAKVHLVDTVAAMISGSALPPGRRALAYVESLGGHAECSVFGTRLVTSPVNAAFANGMFAHADETDDTHPPSRTHPGASVVPAAFAIGEREGHTGALVLRALVVGYDVCSRLLLAMDESKFRYTGHHASSFGGVFGAAAASACLMRLDAQRVRHVLSYAAEQAAGLYTMHRDTEHVEKAFAMGGMTAHNGTAAALMVASGFTGVDDVFSGDRDFFLTFAPHADRAQLAHELGSTYEILRCGIKRWTCGGPIQGPLDVLQTLVRKYHVSASNIETMFVRMPDKELETVNDRDMPNICVQHLLALMLVDGTVTFRSAHDRARMRDPQVLAARARIRMQGDPALTDYLRRWRSAIRIVLSDGRELAHETLSARGGFDNPLTREDEQEKALDLIGPVLGSAAAEALLEALWNFDTLRDIRELRRLLR